ncbi:histidine phosphatase family protein [Ectobacillus polymachus]|uniref:histidine phosphatase family protein n=1 Tax=Ectobacillus polymachus TaxID=1508806 RepID=UPI003A8571A1
MTDICLVRHGQTDWNFQGIIQGREDIPLNEVGRMQAMQSASLLQKQEWDAIVSSPLVRAYETAKIIADKAGIDTVHIDERFVERSFGEVSGKHVSNVRHLIASGNVNGMETDEEIVNRCFSGLCHIAERFDGKRIIIVAHSHAIKAMLHAISPNEITFNMPLENACANFISYHNKSWQIERYNVAEHIQV